MREIVSLALSQVFERILHLTIVDITPVPVIRVAAWAVHIQSILADKRQVRIQRDADAIVTRNLKSRSSVVRAQHGLQLLLFDEGRNVLHRLLELVDLLLILRTAGFHLLNLFLHMVFSSDE